MRTWLTALLLLSACAGAHQAPAAASASSASRTSFEFREEAVTIPVRGLVLEGTLAIPDSTSPRRAVVLVHGSGPLGRDAKLPGQLGVQFGFEVSLFEELSDALARAGYVVIRYDKRTCTPSEGCDNGYPEDTELHFDDLVRDAQAVTDWLRERPEVDGAAMFIIGHSQGGAYVPELLVDDPELRAGVILAGPYRPIDQLAAYQAQYVERLLLHRDTHPLVRGVRLGLLRRTAEGLQQLRAGTLTKPMIGDAPAVYWQEWMESGDILPALIDRLDRPLLVLSGELDTNVPPSETELWRQKFEASGAKPGHQTFVLPCITHAFNCVRTDARGRMSPDRHVSPVVIEHLLRFLRTDPPPRRGAQNSPRRKRA